MTDPEPKRQCPSGKGSQTIGPPPHQHIQKFGWWLAATNLQLHWPCIGLNGAVVLCRINEAIGDIVGINSRTSSAPK
eukprot:5916399-Amphidinium_carterae.1